MPARRIRHLFTALCTLALLAAYLSASAVESEPGKAALDAMADAARSALLDERPELAAKLDQLPGYAVIAMSAAKLPGVGAGQGYGVIVDNRDQQRSYMKVTQLEVGGGVGAQKYKAIILLEEASLVDRMIEGGVRYESAAELGAGAGDARTEVNTATGAGQGYEVIKLSEGGVAATITVRALQGKPYLPE